METHPIDPIISEVRAVRDAHAARFNYDVAAIFRDIRAMQEESGRDYIRLPSRPVVASVAPSANLTPRP
ncbi:MAG: hypothetical protein OXP75_18260 [Rhodospirillales bacterium]|nr:hypothetical protein [Rhodospirillales bacterium]